MSALSRSGPTASMQQQAESLLVGLSEATVLAAMSPQLPETLLAALLGAGRRLDVRITLMVSDLSGQWSFLDDAALADAAAARLRLIALAGGVPRRAARLVDHLPVSLWDADRLIASEALPIDVFVARVGESGGSRRLSYGDMIGYSASALNVARRVGFEVVAERCQHPGAAGISPDRADVVIRRERMPAPQPRKSAPSPEQQAAACRVASLLPDGATLQLGVGGVPANLAEHLHDKRDLGLHSGVLPGQIQGLINRGVITGARKTHEVGQHVATGLLGGDPAEWGADILLEPISQTHHPGRLLEHQNLWAINSAFEVDLAGQVNAEFADDQKVASGAGQIDFARAAHACPNGGVVVALPARSRSGAPRIVAHLAHSATTSGSDIDYVITEHGVARLHELTAHERSEALIEIAHPDDRAGLRAAVTAESQ